MPAHIHRPRDEQQLLEHLALDSEDAFRERYEQTLLTKAFCYLVCEHDARDCLQDVFVSIWVKRSSLRIDNLHNYLHQAVRFRALRRRRENHQESSLDERLPRISDPFLPSDALDYKDLHRRLSSRIRTLPTDQQRIFSLHRDEGFSYQQIAPRLNISVKTVEKKMSLALRFLRGSALR